MHQKQHIEVPELHQVLSTSHAVLQHFLSAACTLVNAYLLLIAIHVKHRHERANPASFTLTKTMNERQNQLTCGVHGSKCI